MIAKKKALLVSFVFTFQDQVLAADDSIDQLKAPTIEVVAPIPVPGLDIPKNQVPANVQSATAAQMREKQSLNIPDFINQAIGSVSINDTQNNPYQPDVNYRGFTASPLLGTPQGISVYQDGVRINEPFGDVVNWDLIPQSAVSTISVIPGSNPLFGLNTLGGALSIRTKSGIDHPGTRARAYAGSFDRRVAELEHGGLRGDLHYFITGHWFKEDGWRDFSPSDVRQLFAKFGRRGATSDLDLNITRADTDLTGNGLAPTSMFKQERDQVFTVPDNTRNRMTMLNLIGRQWLGEDKLVSGNAYYRQSRRRTLNGDMNDEFEDSPNDGATGANAGLGFNDETAVNNRTRTGQRGYGLALQLTVFRPSNQFTIGASYDGSRSEFEQSTEEGVFDVNRAVIATEDKKIENSLSGRARTRSLFFTNTYAIRPQTHLTISGRYNRTAVETNDRLNRVPPNLDADFTYTKFNPAVGLTHIISPGLTAYAGYSQGNRTPTPIELGCADPDNPCTLPNALVSDPFLKQVVARTIEAGLRGGWGRDIKWSAGVFRTINKDDILFISTAASTGFFTNFGKTQREGIELGLGGRLGSLNGNINYSYIDAAFESSACLLSPNNSTRGTSICPSDDEILISPGDRIPGIPKHNLKLSLDYRATENWSAGADFIAFSSQFVRGNENNDHQAGAFTDKFGNTRTSLRPGRVPGYGIVNLRTRYRFAKNWELFAKISNLLDQKYFTAGGLAENPFSPAGVFQTSSDAWTRETFVAPGAPRAGWIGVQFLLD